VALTTPGLHLPGRVAHAMMLNVARGAKLHGIFEQIEWDGD
jgi:hypothetical protein